MEIAGRLFHHSLQKNFHPHSPRITARKFKLRHYPLRAQLLAQRDITQRNRCFDELSVEDMPVTVAVDSDGHNVHQFARLVWKENIAREHLLAQ